MLYEFRLSLIVPQMTGGTVECVHAKPGDFLKMGSKLLDVSVDLSSAFAQECPPVSYFRVVLREPALLRELNVVPGQFCHVGDNLAIFSSDADEIIGLSAPRAVRTTIAGIMHHDGMWTGNRR